MGCILTKCSRICNSSSAGSTCKPNDEEKIASSMSSDDVIQMEERCHDDYGGGGSGGLPMQHQPTSIVNENVSSLDFDFEAELIKAQKKSTSDVMAAEECPDENGFTRVSLKRKSSFSDQSEEDGGEASLESFGIEDNYQKGMVMNGPIAMMTTPSIVIEADDDCCADGDDMDLLAAALESDDDCPDPATPPPPRPDNPNNFLQVPRKSFSEDESEEEDCHYRALMDRFTPSPPPPPAAISSEDKSCSFREEVAVGSLRTTWSNALINRSRSILQDINEEFDEEEEEMEANNKETGVGNKGYHTSDEEDSVCTIDRDCSMDDEDAATVDANVCRSSRSSGEARAKRAAYKEGITKRGSSSSAGSCVPPSPVISVAEENQVESMETVQVLLSSHIQPTLRSSFHSIIIPVHSNKSC